MHVHINLLDSRYQCVDRERARRSTTTTGWANSNAIRNAHFLRPKYRVAEGFRRRRRTYTFPCQVWSDGCGYCGEIKTRKEHSRSHVAESSPIVRRRRVPQAIERIGFRTVAHGDDDDEDCSGGVSVSPKRFRKTT